MKLGRILGMLMVLAGIAVVVLYNLVLGGTLAFAGALFFMSSIFAEGSKRLHKDKIVSDYKHKLSAWKLQTKSDLMKKKLKVLEEGKKHHKNIAKNH